MKSNLSILLLIVVSLFSCGDDDLSNNQNNTNLDDPRLIRDLIWETYIDEDFEELVETSSTQVHFLRHTIISEELVIFYNSLERGFVAINRNNGEEAWNNYSEISCSGVRNKPILHEGALYFACTSQEIYKIDISTGNIVTSFSWPNESETVDDHIAIIDGRLYVQAYTSSQASLTSTWYSSFVDDLSPNSFNSFNPEGSFMLDIPQQATNAEGHSLLIYTTKRPDLCLTVYNLSTNTTEWEFCDFENNSALSRNSVPVIDEDDAITIFMDQTMYKFDLSGQLIWSKEILENNFSEVNDAMINTDFGYFYIGWNGSLLIDKNTGETLWHFERYMLDTGDEKVLRKGDDTPIAINDKVYFFDGIQGYLITQDLVNGDLEYHFISPSKIIGDTNFSGFGNFSNSEKVISEDNILYTSDLFTMLAFPLPE